MNFLSQFGSVEEGHSQRKPSSILPLVGLSNNASTKMLIQLRSGNPTMGCHSMYRSLIPSSSIRLQVMLHRTHPSLQGPIQNMDTRSTSFTRSIRGSKVIPRVSNPRRRSTTQRLITRVVMRAPMNLPSQSQSSC